MTNSILPTGCNAVLRFAEYSYFPEQTTSDVFCISQIGISKTGIMFGEAPIIIGKAQKHFQVFPTLF
jgi:hypothetical protein